ncbi:MAG TPA: TlpA disulfide reductase family protein [Phnomibacter sp.]|nr:TlpA disulfide reductase family protein [Phnomibacter sp.]
MKSVSKLAAVVLVALCSCKQQENRVLVVSGNIRNAAGKKIMLAELPYASSSRLVVDSATILDSSGNFRLQASQSQENVYQLFVSNGAGFLLINDADNISVTADVLEPEKYTVQGSPASLSIQQLYKSFLPAYNNWQAANEAVKSMEQNKQTGDSARSAVLQQRDQQQQQLNNVLIQYIQTEPNATARYFGLGMAKNFLSPTTWNEQLEKSIAAFPNHPGLSVLKVKAGMASEQGSHLLNKSAPELVMQDTSGADIALSSFRGRWVLVDCWASWCAPCRKENPNILAAYRKLNKRNFTVLGVSLDKERAAWLQAIQKDTLIWTHVSDLKYWDSKAASTFEIQSLPFNMLVDPRGTVVAINLTGDSLTQKIAALLK